MDNEISFTFLVKQEIASQEFEENKIRAILSAFSKINGRLSIQNDSDKIILQTENAKVAKFIFKCLQVRYKISPRFAYLKSMHFKKSIVYHVIIEQKVDEILKDLEMLSFEGNTKSFVRSGESLEGFLIGSFLASGSVNSPYSSNYHLEISTIDEELSKYIANVITRIKYIEFKPRIIKRRNHYVVYLKKSDQIADFLKLLGASDCCLEYEDVRINRDYNNNDNRLQICTDANMFRTVQSAQKQIEDIKLIDQMVGLKNIGNDKLRLLAELRLEYEGASMIELAELLSEKLEKTISKSSVNHMFRAIKEKANAYRKGETPND